MSERGRAFAGAARAGTVHFALLNAPFGSNGTAPEAGSTQLGEMFEARVIPREGFEAADEGCQVARAGGLIEADIGRAAPGDARDLAGAVVDQVAEHGFHRDEVGFEAEAEHWVGGEAFAAAGLCEAVQDRVGDAAQQRIHTAETVGGEERAQDEPDQLHGLEYKPAYSPAGLRGPYPTVFCRWAVICGRKIFCCPAVG